MKFQSRVFLIIRGSLSGIIFPIFERYRRIDGARGYCRSFELHETFERVLWLAAACPRRSFARRQTFSSICGLDRFRVEPVIRIYPACIYPPDSGINFDVAFYSIHRIGVFFSLEILREFNCVCKLSVRFDMIELDIYIYRRIYGLPTKSCSKKERCNYSSEKSLNI